MVIQNAETLVPYIMRDRALELAMPIIKPEKYKR